MSEIETGGNQLTQSGGQAGDLAVLVHCSSSCSQEWDGLRIRLETDFQTVTPDLWGADPAGAESDGFTVAAEAAPLLALLDRTASPAHLVGHGYGGGVALHVALRRPRLIASLTLIEPCSFHLLADGDPRNLPYLSEIADVADRLKTALRRGDDHSGALAAFARYWGGPDSWEAMPDAARALLGRRLGKIVQDFRALFDEPATLADYRSLSMPTLLVCGESSPGPSRRIVELLARAMPQAELMTVPGAGRLSPLGHTDALDAAIAGHLRRQRSRGDRRAA